MHRSILVPVCAVVFAASAAACGDRAPGADGAAAGTADSARAGDTAAPARTDGVTAVTPADSACAPAPLADTAAGPVAIGMTVDAIRARCPGTRDSTGLGPEGMPARALVVPVGRDTVEASIVDGRVWRLAVTSPGLRTADSLGVGTPLSRLLALPGARGIHGEGRSFIIADEPCGMSFQLDVRGGPSTDEGIRKLPGGTRVERVLVTGCGGP